MMVRPRTAFMAGSRGRNATEARRKAIPASPARQNPDFDPESSGLAGTYSSPGSYFSRHLFSKFLFCRPVVSVLSTRSRNLRNPTIDGLRPDQGKSRRRIQNVEPPFHFTDRSGRPADAGPYRPFNDHSYGRMRRRRRRRFEFHATDPRRVFRDAGAYRRRSRG